MMILSSCGFYIFNWTLTLTLTLNLVGYLPSVYLSSCTWSVAWLLPISSHPRKCSIWSFHVVAILVAAFPIWCVVLVIFFLCFCGGLLDGVFSSSLHSLICLVANIFWIFWHFMSLSQRNCMSIAFVHFGCILPLHTEYAIALSVCNGVVGWLCPISYNIIMMYNASHAMMYSAASSDSVADVMTCLIMWAMLIIVPLFWGIIASLDKKKCPPARLLAFGSLS